MTTPSNHDGKWFAHGPVYEDDQFKGYYTEIRLFGRVFYKHPGKSWSVRKPDEVPLLKGVWGVPSPGRDAHYFVDGVSLCRAWNTSSETAYPIILPRKCFQCARQYNRRQP